MKKGRLPLNIELIDGLCKFMDQNTNPSAYRSVKIHKGK